MIIEKLQAKHLPGLLPLVSQLGYPTTLKTLEERFSRVNTRTDQALFVATESGTSALLGWCHLVVDPPSMLGEPRVELVGLVVSETSRGKGIGRALLDRGEGWAKENGFSSIRLRTNVTRKEAHRFYERAGYKIAKSWHLYTKEV